MKIYNFDHKHKDKVENKDRLRISERIRLEEAKTAVSTRRRRNRMDIMLRRINISHEINHGGFRLTTDKTYNLIYLICVSWRGRKRWIRMGDMNNIILCENATLK